MKNIDIIYFIEHAAREIDTACIVKLLCEKKYGLSVKIASLPYGLHKITRSYLPACVVLPFFYALDNQYIHPMLRYWKNVTFINLNCEQFLNKANETFKAPRDSFVKENVYQIAWTASFKDYLIRHGCIEGNIFLTGNPSFALYCKPYNAFFATRAELAVTHHLDPDKKWVFFPENFFWAFISDDRLNTYIESGYDRETALNKREHERQSLDKCIDWLGMTAGLNNVEIIFRPRPAISTGEYHEILRSHLKSIPPSLHVIKSGSIREWNMASDLVISTVSTSLIESAFVDKPTYILEPYPIPEYSYSKWMHTLPHVHNKEELFALCSNAITAPVTSAAFSELFMPDGMDHRKAIDKIAESIHLISRQVRHAPGYNIAAKLHDTVNDIKKHAADLFNIRANHDIALPKKHYTDDHITESGIYERINKWAGIVDTLNQ